MSNPNRPADHPDNIDYYYSQTHLVAYHIKEREVAYYSTSSFSRVVSRLTELWLEWMKQNKIATDETLSSTLREQAATKCEELINEEYILTAQLDEYFE